MSAVEWVVLVFDKPNVDRSTIRPEHLKGIAPTVNDGIVKAAGAFYHDIEKTKFAGSTYHLVAKDKPEIIEFLKKDPYYKAGIWDIDSVIAYPAGIAVRVPTKFNGVNDSLYKI